MTIQMKRINPALWKLYKGKLTHTKISEKRIDKIWDTVDQWNVSQKPLNVGVHYRKVQDTSLSNSGKLQVSYVAPNLSESTNSMRNIIKTINKKALGALLGAKVIGYSLVAIVADEIFIGSQRKKLIDATGHDKEEIAMDINELKKFRDRGNIVRVFGDDIRYTAQLRKEWLGGIETIMGDASLEALDSFYCLSNLEKVYGNLSFSQVEDAKVDLSGLHIQLVAGDIHAERAISTSGLEELFFVGGNIYYQDNVYTLDQFQNLIRENKEGYEYKLKK